MTDTFEQRVQERTERMLAACREHDLLASLEGRVDENVAAKLLGYAAGTLSNWRSQLCEDAPPYYRSRAGRVLYDVVDLAEWVELERVDQHECSREITRGYR